MLYCFSHSLLKISILCLILSGFSTLTRAEPFETIINNGDSQNRFDIAVMGDGYTAAEMEKYRADVQNFMQGIFAQEPYREYQRYFNVHRIDVVSNQSGADHPERNPPVFVDTALDATYNCGDLLRLICINQVKVYNIIFRTLSASHYDVILVLVNDPQSGGMGGQVPVASAAGPNSVETILHELGHSFARLADEYTDPGSNCTFMFEPNEANATQETNRSLIKWNHWIDPTTPIPTTTFDFGIPGLYLGGRHCETGFYRPTYSSKMRQINRPFEQINTEQHVKRLYNFVSPIDDSSPAGNTVSLNSNQSQTFSIITPQPFTHTLNVNWLVDGQQKGSGTSFTLNGATLASGTHTVSAMINDPTPFVRNDPQQLLWENRDWTVNVQTSAQHTLFDFDGDGKADISVFRPSNGFWYVLKSSGGFSSTQWGLGTDDLVPGDYDGDGKTDIAVYRNMLVPIPGENSVWYILRSSDGSFQSKVFGFSGGVGSADSPLPADYDGDGKTDLAVYSSTDIFPSPIFFKILQSSDNSRVVTQWGLSADQRVPADYDGDGKADLAVFRTNNFLGSTELNTWFILQSSNNVIRVERFGLPDDEIVPGDYDRDGKADIAVWRPSNGTWYIINSSNGAFNGSFSAVQFGASEDKPVPADYDGDGKTDIAVFRPSNGVWYLLKSTEGFSAQQFGFGDDIPIPYVFVRKTF